MERKYILLKVSVCEAKYWGGQALKERYGYTAGLALTLRYIMWHFHNIIWIYSKRN